jgi:hexokinase
VVDALCNDTVGTLMANAYQKKSKDCRIGVILGTGTNAAYSDPLLDDLIINIEWGGFDKFERRTEFDVACDENSGNPGRQVLEKMVSGLYLGEVVRLATIKALQSQGASVPNNIKVRASVETADISNLLAGDEKLLSKSALADLDRTTLSIMKRISEAVLDRSAAVSAAVLAGVVSKATAGQATKRCEVGIDGSLFTKGHEYKARLLRHLRKFYPTEDIVLDFSEDGSGMGAALVAAALSRGRQVSDRDS